MKCLILYGTTEGQTRKIARFVRDGLAGGGHDVMLVDAVDAPPDLDLRHFDRILVMASVHVGRYQAAIEDWARRHAAELAQAGAAFLSVSLAAAGTDDDDVQGLAHCVAEFERRTGWKPALVHHAAGAFRYTEYDFFKRWALKYIAWRKGGPTDTSKDYELTDWEDLSAFAARLASPAVTLGTVP